MQPTIIQGPAVIKRGTHVVYSQGDVIAALARESWQPQGAITGGLGERHRSSRFVISCTPVGEVEAMTGANSYWPHTPADIGKSVFGAAPVALEIIPLTGNKFTYPRSAVTRMPGLALAPTKTAWQAMEWTCLGDPAKEPTDAAYMQTLAATVADTGFDQAKVISPRYTGAWGLAPFDLLEPEDGFDVSPLMTVREMSSVNYGLQDLILTGLGVQAVFVPVNLSEADIATLVRLQGAGAVLPGQDYSNPADARDLVISGTGLTVTLKNMGAKLGGYRFGSGVWRQNAITMVNRRTWAAGVPDALWTLA